MDLSPPGSSLHGILQARILEWTAIPSSRRSFWHRDRTHVSCIYCIGRGTLPLSHLGSREGMRGKTGENAGARMQVFFSWKWRRMNFPLNENKWRLSSQWFTHSKLALQIRQSLCKEWLGEGGKGVERLGSLCSGPDGRGRETAGYCGPYFLQVSKVSLMLHVKGRKSSCLGWAKRARLRRVWDHFSSSQGGQHRLSCPTLWLQPAVARAPGTEPLPHCCVFRALRKRRLSSW